MMHVLAVTHLIGCVEMEIVALFLSLQTDDWTQGSCLALKPLVSHLRYASQVIPIRSQYLCPSNYRPFKVIQGNTVTLAHSDEPYMQKYGKVSGNPDSTN